MTKLKTLNELYSKEYNDKNYSDLHCCEYECQGVIRHEAIKYIKNLQSSKTIYPIILSVLPENMKGEYAKDLWNNTTFKYGAEYGMISLLVYIFNITEEDLK